MGYSLPCIRVMPDPRVAKSPSPPATGYRLLNVYSAIPPQTAHLSLAHSAEPVTLSSAHGSVSSSAIAWVKGSNREYRYGTVLAQAIDNADPRLSNGDPPS